MTKNKKYSMKFKSLKDIPQGVMQNPHNHPVNNLPAGAPAPSMDFTSMGNTGNDGADPHTNRTV